MMNSFYQDHTYSWLPMRFMIDGLKDIFFFGTGVTWENTKVLVWIFIVGVILIVASAFMPKKSKDRSKRGRKYFRFALSNDCTIKFTFLLIIKWLVENLLHEESLLTILHNKVFP